MIQFEIEQKSNSMIMVIGIGGGGNNAVNYMNDKQIPFISYMICNTDTQVLDKSNVDIKIPLGPNLTKGLGAGANPKIGEQATIESKQEILKVLQNDIKMVFITAGMGGGTGTGGAPVIAEMCKELGILTVAIVTTPFYYEGKRRMQHALSGIEELKKRVDIIIVINNDKIRLNYGNLSISEAFAKANDVVSNAIKSITNVIYTTGRINVDFADINTVMRNGGVAIMGVATASGTDRAFQVTQEALTSPLLNDMDIVGAKHILLNISTPSGKNEITSDEIEIIQKQILDKVGTDTDLHLGIYDNNNSEDAIEITLIITGFKETENSKNENHKTTNNEFIAPCISPSTTKNKTIYDKENYHDLFSNNYNDSSNNIDNNIKDESIDSVSFSKNDFLFKNPELTIATENNDMDKNLELNKKNTREKLFEPFTYDIDKAEIQKKIFLEKKFNEINFDVPSNFENKKNSTLSLNVDQKDNVSIKKINEYNQYYAEKRPC